MRTLTSEESGRSPTRTAQSKPSPARSTTRSLRFSEIVTSACDWRNSGTSGATWRRPNPAGAVMRRCPLALTPPADTLASALATSISKRWQSSRKALPSWVSEIRRVVRTSSLTPRRSSSASSRRPMMAGATPSALAAAVRLPRVATETKDSICLSLLMARDYGHKRWQWRMKGLYCTVVASACVKSYRHRGRVSAGSGWAKARTAEALLRPATTPSAGRAGPPSAKASAGSRR